MQKSLEERRKNVSRHLREVVVIIVMDAHPKIVNKLIISNIRLSARTKNTLKNAKSRGSRVTNRRAACSTRPKSANISTWCNIQTISWAEGEANATKNSGQLRIWAPAPITLKMSNHIKLRIKLNSTSVKSNLQEIKPKSSTTIRTSCHNFRTWPNSASFMCKRWLLASKSASFARTEFISARIFGTANSVIHPSILVAWRSGSKNSINHSQKR